MADITIIDDNNIVAFLHNPASLVLPKPFGQQIFLVEAHIAGTTHIGDIDNIEPHLTEGMKLKFVREISNEYDPMAIMVKENKEKKLGYIPRNKNEILSRLMDAGKLIYGTIHKKERVGKWLKITIQIFLSD
jgi:hypothetical protein